VRMIAGIGLVAAFTAGVVHAEELALSNGDHWQVDGTILHRTAPEPRLDVTMNLYSVGVNCEAGLKSSSNVVKPPYAPPTFYANAFEQADEGAGDAYATVCTDLPRQVLVANLLWKKKLAAADAASFRDLLEYLTQGLLQNPPLPAPGLPLFDPPTVSVALDAKTGVWNFIRDRTTANVTTLVQLWPKASILLQLQRSEGAQQCSSVGFGTATPRPTWAPNGFYAYGAHKDGAGFACLDGPGGRLVMASVTEAHLTPDDVQHVGALLDVVATGLKNSLVLLPPKVEPAPATP
jgi:hypothetical protein